MLELRGRRKTMTEKKDKAMGTILPELGALDDYPPEIFKEVDTHVTKAYIMRFGSAPRGEQIRIVKDCLVLWLDIGEDPFEIDKNLPYRSSLTGERVDGRDIQTAVIQLLPPTNPISLFLRGVVKREADSVVKRYADYKEERKKEISKLPKPEKVPGDPELTSPQRGVAGVKGYSAPKENDDQSRHHGPGYDT